MLAVGVDLDENLVAMAVGVTEPGAHGRADPEVERVTHHRRPGGEGPLGGGIGRTVIDDEDVGAEFGSDRRNDVTN